MKKKIDQLDLLSSTFLLIFYKTTVKDNYDKRTKVSESYLTIVNYFFSFSKADWDLNMEKKLRSSHAFS